MNKFFGVLCLLSFFISCSSDLDVEQTQDLKLNPVLTANFATFDIKPSQFLIGGAEQTSLSNELLFDIATYSLSTKYMNQADFNFEFTNTINRAYSISINFVDNNNATLYSLLVAIPPYSGSPVTIKRPEIFTSTKLDLIRKTYKISFEALMLPGTPLTNNSLGSLKMRSSATIYFLSK